jgi:hypothetical protein
MDSLTSSKHYSSSNKMFTFAFSSMNNILFNFGLKFLLLLDESSQSISTKPYNRDSKISNFNIISTNQLQLQLESVLQEKV